MCSAAPPIHGARKLRRPCRAEPVCVPQHMAAPRGGRAQARGAVRARHLAGAGARPGLAARRLCTRDRPVRVPGQARLAGRAPAARRGHPGRADRGLPCLAGFARAGCLQRAAAGHGHAAGHHADADDALRRSAGRAGVRAPAPAAAGRPDPAPVAGAGPGAALHRRVPRPVAAPGRRPPRPDRTRRRVSATGAAHAPYTADRRPRRRRAGGPARPLRPEDGPLPRHPPHHRHSRLHLPAHPPFFFARP